MFLLTATLGENFSKIGPYLGAVSAQKPPKRTILWMLYLTQNFQIIQIDNYKYYTDETYHDYVSS